MRTNQGYSILDPDVHEEYSGVLSVRVPLTLWRTLITRAEAQQLSFTETIVRILQQGVLDKYGISVPSEVRALSYRRANTSTSGSWMQRMPRALHRHLALWARSEGVSLNMLLVYVLTRYSA